MNFDGFGQESTARRLACSPNFSLLFHRFSNGHVSFVPYFMFTAANGESAGTAWFHQPGEETL
jgi:hypothetical protein